MLAAVKEPRSTLAALVRKHRNRSAMTLRDLAAAAAVSTGQLSLLENGKRAGVPDDDAMLRRIAAAIGLDGDEVVWLAHLSKTPADVLRRLNELESKT